MNVFKNVYMTFLIINLKRYTADSLPLSEFCSHCPAGNKRKSDKRINFKTTNEYVSEALIFPWGQNSKPISFYSG
jgi:hypothetical protein